MALLGFGIRAGVRANNRTKAAGHLQRGDAGYASVSLALDVTELNARTIPEASSYGTLVLEKYRNFSTRYLETRTLNEQSHAFTKKDLGKSGNVATVARYADMAEDLNTLESVIGDTNALLNRYAGWEGAWDRQVRPFREDLAQLSALIGQKEAQGLASTAALASLHGQRSKGVEQLAADFHSGLITPDAALDELRGMSQEFTALLQQHSEAMIGKYTKTNSEKASMEKAMESSRMNDVRGRRTTILGSVFDGYMFYPVHSFSAGYLTGQDKVDTARTQKPAPAPAVEASRTTPVEASRTTPVPHLGTHFPCCCASVGLGRAYTLSSAAGCSAESSM